MTLLICPVRPGDSNEELRYALRSWETNLLMEDLTLMTVGYKPSWLAPDIHVPGNKFKSMPMAVFDNVHLGAKSGLDNGVSDAIYMNDDFFCLDPVGAVPVVRRNCSLAEQISQFPENAGLWWPRSLRLTASWLAEQGFNDPHSYEVHRPLSVRLAGMSEALDRWGPANKEDMVPQWRTIYGVLNFVGATPVRDAKLSPRQTGYGTPWVSTSDESWRRYSKEIIRGFQKPSRWEG